MIQLDEKLTPLMAAMKAVLYQGRVIHIDVTRLQVLEEPGREASQQSFMGVYRGGAPETIQAPLPQNLKAEDLKL